MKKITGIAFLFVTLSAGFVNAQNNKVVSAWKYLHDYRQDKDPSTLANAKNAIDLATVNEKTKDEPKTWVYRGQVYETLFETALADNMKKNAAIKDMSKKLLTSYQATDTSALEQAYKAYTMAKKLDVKNYYTDQIGRGLGICSRHFENKAIADYNSGNMAGALPLFEAVIDIKKGMGITDTMSIKNAAIVAMRTKNYDKAKKYYKQMIDIKAGGSAPYSALSKIYLAQKDTANALAEVQQGRKMFPDSINLMIAETNFYLHSNKRDKAINNLHLAIAKIPQGKDDKLLANLELVLGNIYDKEANPKDAKGNDMPAPANYDSLFAKASRHYKRAVTLRPDYFDALYNLGALYNNRGVAMNKKANDLPIDQTAKFNKLNDLAKKDFMAAEPYLEKALKINPKDQGTIEALKQIYARTGQTDKLKQLTGAGN